MCDAHTTDTEDAGEREVKNSITKIEARKVENHKGQKYDQATIVISGVHFHADIHGEEDVSKLRRMAEREGLKFLDWRHEPWL